MDFVTAVKTCFSKYATFQGRALRSEFWWWTLFTTVVSIVLTIIDGLLFGSQFEDTGVLDGIFSLATLIPTIAVTARRLHDVGRSGWWQLIAFTIVGLIPLLYWLIIEGNQGANEHGPHPLHGDEDTMADVFR